MASSKRVFESFVVADGNLFAYAAASAVAEALGKSYNPLVLHGKARTGKTHLLHAISERVSKTTKNARVAQFSAEQLADALADAIQNNRLADFHEQQLQLDLLLIDDMQFLAGKQLHQEWFLYLFSKLHEAQKQIVIAIDTDFSVCESQELLELIAQQFEWSLIAELRRQDEGQVSLDSKVIPLFSTAW